MSATFVIPASPSLFEAIESIRPIHRDDLKRTRQLCSTIGTSYVDDVVDGLVLDFLRESASATPRTRSLVETLAGLIKKVAHALIGQAFGKLTHEQAAELLAFLDDRASRFGDRPGLAVPICEDTARGIETAIEAAVAGRLVEHRTRLVETMHLVIHRSLEYHYQKPFGLLELGFLTRKGVDLGYDAILSGSLSTIEKTIAEADEAQLAELATFLAKRLVR